MNRILGVVPPLFAALLAGNALAGPGEVGVAVNWPGEAAEARVVRISDPGKEVSVLVDREGRSIKLVNFPVAWDFHVSRTSERRPSISVTYGSALGRKQILIGGYSEQEKLTEAVLDSAGESAELMVTRCTIQLVEGP
jgi:hypothetical protein